MMMFMFTNGFTNGSKTSWNIYALFLSTGDDDDDYVHEWLHAWLKDLMETLCIGLEHR